MKTLPRSGNRRQRGYSCKVLSYHRVLPAHKIQSQLTQRCLAVTTKAFRRHLVYVRDRYQIITIEEFVRAISSGSGFERPSCIITFDDGWRDNYLYAYPILKELSIPATVFVVTDHVNTGAGFWPESLTRIVLKMNSSEEERERLRDNFANVFGDDKGSLGGDPMDFANRAIISLKNRPLESILDAIAQLRKSCGEQDDGERCICSWEELREMAGSKLFTIGSHTKSHAILTNETTRKCREEIFDSKRVIERELGITVSHFSYPNGNFDPIIEQIVKEAGYKSACTCLNGSNNGGTSPYRIRRVHVFEPPDMTIKSSNLWFGLKISNFWQELKRLRNSIGAQPY